MAELAAVLAKRRRKSEVAGAIVENTPTATFADAGHTTASTSTEHGGEIVSAEVHSDNQDSTFNRADGELKKILQRRRRRSETSSSVFIKEARESEADAKHTHQAYSDSSCTVESSAQGAIELRLKSLEMKVELQQNQLEKAEMTVIRNGRLLSTFSPLADGEVVDTIKSSSEPALARKQDNASVSGLSEGFETAKQKVESSNNIGISSISDAKNDLKQMVDSAKNIEAKNALGGKVGHINTAATDIEAKDEEDDSKQVCAGPVPQTEKEKPPVSDLEEVREDTPDPGESEAALVSEVEEKKAKVAGDEMKDRQQNADGDEEDENHGNIKLGDGAKDKQSDVSNTGKIEAKPGLFVTPSELAQLRIFLPGFKSVPNERLLKVLPRLMSKTPGDLSKKKGSNLDNRPRWK